jgi:tetratricopeptide (TPR) repeat protein
MPWNVFARWMVLNLLLITGHVAMAADVDADVLIKNGHYKHARAVLEKRLAANPKDAQALTLMALVKLAFRDFDGATKVAEQAVGLNGKDAQAHAVSAECYGSKTKGDVGMFEGLRLARSVKSEAETALAIDPKNYLALRSLMEFYMEAPGIIGGSNSQADAMAAKIMAIDPAKGYLAKAEIATQNNQSDQVASLYLKAAEADPKSYDVCIRLGGLYLAEKTHDLNKAEDYSQKAIQLDPERAAGWGLLAIVTVQKGDMPGLDKLLVQAEKAAPDNLAYYFRAARALSANGKDDVRAEKLYKQYLCCEPEAGAPTLAMTHWQYGLTLEKGGRVPEAIQELQTAVKMDSNLNGAQQDLKRLLHQD